MVGVPAPPRLLSPRDYGDRLGDVGFWMPYVAAVLERHRPAGDRARRSAAHAEAGFIGTYPTFLIADVVVKLFGFFPSWRTDHAAELGAQRLLAGHPAIPAPRLLAYGRLYDDPDCWPYLVTERVTGRAWRDAALTRPQQVRVAGQLGAAVRRVHDLPVPVDGPLARDWLTVHGPGCAGRHREWGSLPAHLVDEVDAYRCPPSPVPRLVHADLTADHIFVDGDRLVAIIDWGDAMTTDPHYELGALHLGAFRTDRALLAAFLAGYGWDVGDEFPRRAMSAALGHQFDLFAATGPRLRRLRTLDEVATALWATTAVGST